MDLKRGSWALAGTCLGLGFLLGSLTTRPSAADPPAVARVDEKPKLPPAAPPDDGKLRILCFGAHPDDCELQAHDFSPPFALRRIPGPYRARRKSRIGPWQYNSATAAAAPTCLGATRRRMGL